MATSADRALYHLLQEDGRVAVARLDAAQRTALEAGITLEESLTESGALSAAERARVLRLRVALARACGECRHLNYLLPGQSAIRIRCEACGGRLLTGNNTRRYTLNHPRQQSAPPASAPPARRTRAHRVEPPVSTNEPITRLARGAAPPTVPRPTQRGAPLDARASGRLARRPAPPPSERNSRRQPRSAPSERHTRRGAPNPASSASSERLTRRPERPEASQRLTRRPSKPAPSERMNRRSGEAPAKPGASGRLTRRPAAGSASSESSERLTRRPGKSSKPDPKARGARTPGARASGAKAGGKKSGKKSGKKAGGARPVEKKGGAKAGGGRSTGARPASDEPARSQPLTRKQGVLSASDPVDSKRLVQDALKRTRAETLKQAKQQADAAEARLRSSLPSELAKAMGDAEGEAGKALAALVSRELRAKAPEFLAPQRLEAPIKKVLDRRLEEFAERLAEADAMRSRHAELAQRLAKLGQRLDQTGGELAASELRSRQEMASVSGEARERLELTQDTLRAELEATRGELDESFDERITGAVRQALGEVHPRGLGGLIQEVVSQRGDEQNARLERRLEGLERRLAARTGMDRTWTRRRLAFGRSLRPALLLGLFLLVPLVLLFALTPAIHEARVVLSVDGLQGVQELIQEARSPEVLSAVATTAHLPVHPGWSESLYGFPAERHLRLKARIDTEFSAEPKKVSQVHVRTQGIGKEQARLAARALADYLVQASAKRKGTLEVLDDKLVERRESLWAHLPRASLILFGVAFVLAWVRELTRRGFQTSSEVAALLDLPVLGTIAEEAH